MGNIALKFCQDISRKFAVWLQSVVFYTNMHERLLV